MGLITLLPASTLEQSGLLGIVGAGTMHGALALNDGGSYLIFEDDNPIDGGDHFAVGFSPCRAVLSINSIAVWLQYFSGAGGSAVYENARLYLKIGGVNYYSGEVGPLQGGYFCAHTWAVNPATGAPWTTVTLNAIQGAGLDFENAVGGTFNPYYFHIDVDAIEAPATVAVSRQLGSVDLWLKRRAEAFLTFQGNLDLMSLDLLDRVDLEHTAGPNPIGNGWEAAAWQRRAFAVHGLTIDMDGMTVTAKLKDQRPIRLLLRALEWSDKKSGNGGDGIARFSVPGSIFTFTRPSTETFTNPVGDSETVPIDTPGYADGGLQILAGARFWVTNNSSARTLSAEAGGFQAEVRFAGTFTANRTIAYGYHDAANLWAIYYDHAAGRITFALRVAGVTVSVAALAAPVAATWYQVGAYWTGANGENGLPPYTLALYVNRVLQGTAQAAGSMVEATTSTFDFGSAGGSSQLLGQIRKIHSYQDVPTDVEMGRPI